MNKKVREWMLDPPDPAMQEKLLEISDLVQCLRCVWLCVFGLLACSYRSVLLALWFIRSCHVLAEASGDTKGDITLLASISDRE